MSKRRLAETLLDAASTLGGAKSGGASRFAPLQIDEQRQRTSPSIDVLTSNFASFALDGSRSSSATPFGFGAGVTGGFMAKTLRERLQKHMGKSAYLSPPRPGATSSECEQALALGSATYPGFGVSHHHHQGKTYSRSPLGLGSGSPLAAAGVVAGGQQLPDFSKCGLPDHQPRSMSPARAPAAAAAMGSSSASLSVGRSPERPTRSLIDFKPVYSVGAPGYNSLMAAALQPAMALEAMAAAPSAASGTLPLAATVDIASAPPVGASGSAAVSAMQ